MWVTNGYGLCRATLTSAKGLFRSIGPVSRLELRYDRAGRSEGTAFVTYETHRDAMDAIREFDGANAAGKPFLPAIA
jgi:THO complex subunit 4